MSDSSSSPSLNRSSSPYLAIRSVMMPRDTNGLGSVFGGHILSLVDLAAREHARTVSPQRFVTKVIREVNFVAPVFVGDSVSFYTSTIRLGKTSVTVRVEVEAQRGVDSITTSAVTTAEVVMVAVDQDNRPLVVFQG